MDITVNGSAEGRWPIAHGGRRLGYEGATRTLALAAVVALSYYAGSLLGLVLRIPPATTSVLWPPNAILTATLLLTPSPRRWWIYLAAAFPAHLAVQQGTGWPLPMILALYITNCSEALLAAWCVRLLREAPLRFDTLRGMFVFLGAAVLVAPAVTSFPDATIVAWMRGEDFWTVWRNRFFANTLTELMLVPGIAMLFGNGAAAVRRVTTGRVVEAALLVLTTIVVAIEVFAGSAGGRDGAGHSARPLAFLLAPLLWGAVRFGPAGASFSLLTMATIALWVATHGFGLTSGLPPGVGAETFQTVTWVIAVPLMCLAAILSERQAAAHDLLDRLRFERMVSELSGAFVQLPSHEMDAAIDLWLARLGERLKLDRLLTLRPDRTGALESVHSWAAPAADRRGLSSPHIVAGLPLIAERILFLERNHPTALDAMAARSWVEVPNVGFVLTVPLIGAGRVLGALVVVRGGAVDGSELDELDHRLSLLADVFASALSRKETEDALRASEETKSAILSSLPTGLAVLDPRGTIVAVNEGWRRWAQEGGVADGALLEGDGYRDVLKQLAAAGTVDTTAAENGVEQVLEGSRATFSAEFAGGGVGRDRHYVLSVVPRAGPKSGAVVSLTDVSERRRAEVEAHNSRDELAHLLRVSTAGVMATSLAHELNQPLTAILANAQAAQRLLQQPMPDLGEVRDILSDVVEQDKHAGEVIQRLREMLRKGETVRAPVRLDDLAREVSRLLANDALIREVSIRLQIDCEAPVVTADRTQVQQVLVNLLLNAMDATAGEGPGPRTVSVVVRERGEGAEREVEVSVRDSGSGLRPGSEEQVFAPFFTTKAGGIGMGLSIARSIITAHGGRIAAANNPEGGATFRFVLPAM